MIEFAQWFFATPVVTFLILGGTAVMAIYTVALQSIYTYLTVVSKRKMSAYAERIPLRDYTYVAQSPLSMPISVLAPAFNEGASIEASMRAILANHYEAIEVIVVNDGSSDDTLTVLKRAFALRQISRTPRSNLPTAEIRAVYISTVEPRLIVIDKENGGKADALNAGLNFARYPLVCSIDADTIVDPSSFEKLVWEFQAHPDTVATGGTVRIANGSVIHNGLVQQVKTAHGLLSNVQIVEYLRAFLSGRVGWSEKDMLLIISGAFGLFKRDALIDIGGYDTTTVGEDAELVLRLYKHFYDNDLPFRASFFPDPVCWTEAPSTMKTLRRQRNRWQRGLMQTLWRHRDMVFRRKYGNLGRYALPYYWLFELIGPVIEVIGYIFVPLALILGIVNWPFAIALFTIATLYGLFLSLVTLTMEDIIPGRYPRWRDLGRLIVAAVVENFGYRQWLAFVRAGAVFSMIRNSGTWGEMERSGFHVDESAVPAEDSDEWGRTTARV